MVGSAKYSVVVPVRDEATVLRKTVPALIAATRESEAEIVYVCNACTDGSAALIRSLAGSSARVVETTEAGKANALNIGDALVCAFPRFYVDADAVLAPGDLARLAGHLERGEAEIVSPRLAWDLSGIPPIPREMARTWLALPYARRAAFQIVIGLSRAGRARWDRFPRILGDDIFMAAMIPADRRRIVDEVRVLTRPPARFDMWVRTRTRWRRGERELLRMGLPLPRVPGQRSLLLRRLASPRTMLGAACFLAARSLGDICSRLPGGERLSWEPERSAGVF